MTDTATITDEFVVNAGDVKAMKETHSLVLFHRPDGSEGTPWGMRLSREVNLDDPIAEQRLAKIKREGVWSRSYADDNRVDYTHTIAADPAHCQIERYRGSSGEVIEAVYVITSIRFGPAHIRTALNAVRPGDSIAVHFVGGNNGDRLNDMGWVRDEVYLRVIRKGKLIGEFMIGAHVGPDDSARYVRSS